MSPRVQNHASETVHGDVQRHPAKILQNDVSHNSGFDFRESLSASVVISTRVDADTNCVPSEVIVAVSINSNAERCAVGRTSLTPETGLKIKII